MTILSRLMASTRVAKSSRKVSIVLTLTFLVSRISGETVVHKLQIELDVNTDIYPMDKDSFYALVLANSLTADGNEEFDLFRQGSTAGAPGADAGSNLIDQYEYVMHGKIFEDKLTGDNDRL